MPTGLRPAPKSKTPNYDNLHPARKVAVNREVAKMMAPDTGSGPKTTVRHPGDIDTFRELVAIKILAVKLTKAMEHIALSKSELQADYENEQRKWRERYRGVMPSALEGEKAPSRREIARNSIDYNGVIS